MSDSKQLYNFEVWALYDHPSDYPDVYIARRFVALPNPPRIVATVDVVQSKDLNVVRAQMSRKGLARVERLPQDDAKIIETWL